jgi:hypothetical protein
MTQLCRVPGVPRKPPGSRQGPMERINVEVYRDESDLVRRAKADAVLRGETFRAWVMRALAYRLEHDREG